MTALYRASKPPFSVVFCNLLGFLEVRQTIVVKTFLLLQGKLHLMPIQGCLPFVTPIGGWAPSQSPVLPYSTEHPPLSSAAIVYITRLIPLPQPLKTVALPTNQGFNPRVLFPQQSLAVYDKTRRESLQFSPGRGFHFQLYIFFSWHYTYV